jgi:hypothetical protein
MRTDVHDLFERFEDAVEDGDFPRAAELAVSIREQQADPDALIADFVEAVENEDYATAEAVLNELARTYEERRASEERRLATSVTAKARTDLSEDERERLHGHGQAGTSVEMTRGFFLANASVFLAAPDDGDREALLELARELTDREGSFSRAADDAAAVTADISLPPEVAVLTAEPTADIRLNGAGELVVTVGNAGDEPVTGVVVRASTDSPVSVSPGERHVGSVGPEEETSVSFSVSGDEAGEHQVTVVATADDSESREAVGVTVLSETETVAEALDEDGDGTLDTPEIQQAITYWANDEPVPGTGGMTIDTETIQQLIAERGDDA